MTAQPMSDIRPTTRVNPTHGLVLTPVQRHALRLFGTIAARSAIATELTADRRLVSAEMAGNLILRVARFQQHVYLVAFVLDELCVVPHCAPLILVGETNAAHLSPPMLRG